LDKNGHDPTRPLPLSQRLAQIIAEDGDDRLTFSDLAARLHARAWGGLLLLFGAINVIPLPPATSWFFAIPLMIVSAQMAAGRSSPWFPARIDRRGVSKDLLRRLVGKMEWLESRVEKLFKPRFPGLTGDVASRVIGVVCFLLSVVAAIPIPLFHMAPAAAVVLFGLALIYRDGALLVVAAIAAVASVVIDALVIGSGVVALTYLASKIGL
jgi:hypothetical protein